MKREDLRQKFEDLTIKIKELENKTYDFKIKRTFSGYDLTNPQTEVYILNIIEHIKEEFDNARKNLENKIKISNEYSLNIKFNGDITVYGYTEEEFEHDFKVSIEQLKDTKKLDDYNKALKLIKKHLSDDDKFEMDMAKIKNI